MAEHPKHLIVKIPLPLPSPLPTQLFTPQKRPASPDPAVDVILVDSNSEEHEPSLAQRVSSPILEPASLLKPVKRGKPTKKSPSRSPMSSPPQYLDNSVLPDYNFVTDVTLPTVDMELGKDVILREYQALACNGIVPLSSPSIARSGIVILPCGAGKTLVAIAAACRIRKSTLVVCSSKIAADQFQREWVKFSTLSPGYTGMFAGDRKFPWNGASGGVLFTTYAALTNSRPDREARHMFEFIEKQHFGLLVLDEVHVVPAATFSRAVCSIRASCRLGLTATMLREDDGIADLDNLVGPVLFQARWRELADLGFIANVLCTQVVCSMTPIFADAYTAASQRSAAAAWSSDAHTRSLLSILNPAKFQACQRLVHYHETRGDKVLLFSDHLFPLRAYAVALGRPFINGSTSQEELRIILQRFRESPALRADGVPVPYGGRFNTVCLSRIGDTSLDLPEATVLIQVSSHFGSRRQEAQRLGRILRAKRRSEEGFHSWFYTLVSDETDEVAFSEKRRRYLEEECGYHYRYATGVEGKVGADLVTRGGLKYVTEEEQIALRDEILALKKVEVEKEEMIESDAEDEAGEGKPMAAGGARGKAKAKGRERGKAPAKRGGIVAALERKMRKNAAKEL
ncbi:component of the holoenzyme form of RNA polymerase transcription factor [Jimgerdemannia flammicorona]|uniref:DNA 3'-5' helicase n=1 Tax=Jimgerdemannia flammicorona TaxID=994334 RepID=A0A433QSC5_9FUNG|nr:component of the holoenzyme form of RNA polymerase transcription factor [Jimgerdemannia flammicorona]